MRQIDQMTPSEIETLYAKGMLPTRECPGCDGEGENQWEVICPDCDGARVVEPAKWESQALQDIDKIYEKGG